MSKQIAAILDDAADRMEDAVWYTGPGSGPMEDRLCVTTAISAAAGPHDVEAGNAFRRHIGRPQQASGWTDLFDWNDNKAKSKKAVIEALRGAAERERGKV